MDPTAFIALAERCAPGVPINELTAIVRQASGFQPLVISTVEGRKPITVQATSKSEAIGLATEMTIAGQRVRIGLAGVDARDLDRLKVSLADAFEPCANTKIAARLMSEDPRRLKPISTRPQRELRPAAEIVDVSDQSSSKHAAEPPAARAWDVYGQGRRSPALIYGSAD
jgi:Transglycosylase SLT domain